jgi:hypothetical protein
MTKFRVYNGPTMDGAHEFRQDSAALEASSWAEVVVEIEERWSAEEGQLLFVVREEETGQGPQFRAGRLFRVQPTRKFRMEVVR